ncbi:MAG: MATE family efflux transporter [Sphaerochaetaceae bacterium]
MRHIRFPKTAPIIMPSGQQVSLIRLTWPLYFDLLLQFLVSNIGQLMIGHYSATAVASIGNANTIINLLNIILSSVGMASTIIISMRIGSGDIQRVSEIFAATLLINGILGMVAAFVAVFLHNPIFTLMRVPAEVLPDARSYITIVGSFMFFQGLYLAYAACFRGFSKMKSTLMVSIAMNVLNIVGNALLIDGIGPIPALGVKGVAIATNLSRITGLLLLMSMFRRKIAIDLTRKAFTPFPFRFMSQLLHIGLPSFAEECSYQLAQMCVMVFVNTLGTIAITTRVYCGILMLFCYLFTQGLGQASQVISGYLTGGGRLDEVSQRTKRTMFLGVGLNLVLISLAYISVDRIFSLFTSDRQVMALAKQVLAIDIVLEMARGVNIILVRTMQATGDVRFPVNVGLVCMWLFQVGGAYLFGIVMGWGLPGIWVGLTADEAVRSIFYIQRWWKGTWRQFAGKLS